MGPLVGLPLAAWLEATADDAAREIKNDIPECAHDEPCRCKHVPSWGCDRCGEYLAPGACSCWDKALAVARAYLDGGEQQ